MSDTPETDSAVRNIPESGHYSAAILEVVDADVARRLERERNGLKRQLREEQRMHVTTLDERDTLLEALTRGDSLGNDLVFLLRYSADLLSKNVPIHEMPTVTELKQAADRILQAIQTVKGKP